MGSDTMGKAPMIRQRRRGPTSWWFVPALVSSLLMFGALGWHVYNTHNVERQIKVDAARTEELRNRLCLFHQQLASNAVMVVASGDARSEQRQRELAAGLGALIDEAREQGPLGYNLSALWEAHEAHRGLRDMEGACLRGGHARAGGSGLGLAVERRVPGMARSLFSFRRAVRQ
jgi:hypothetical protein